LFGYPLQPVDLATADATAAAFRSIKPTHVIHAAAISRIDQCYAYPERASAVNTQGTRQLTELAAEAGARLVYVSTDLVFDGQRGHYTEQDPPAPVSVYGRTKAASEQPVRQYQRGAVVRVSLLLGSTLIGRPGFFDGQLRVLRERNKPFALFQDEWRTPLSQMTAATALLAIADSDSPELLHLGGPERLSRFEVGQRLARYLGSDPELFSPASQADFDAPEPRPSDVSLDSSLWRSGFPSLPWPTLEDALRQLEISL
jgi:dTDP-4-dehydrorhamnose reductase